MAIILVPSLVYLVLAQAVRHRKTQPAQGSDRAHVVTAGELPGAPASDRSRATARCA
jgi:hypothetical protein